MLGGREVHLQESAEGERGRGLHGRVRRRRGKTSGEREGDRERDYVYPFQLGHITGALRKLKHCCPCVVPLVHANACTHAHVHAWTNTQNL